MKNALNSSLHREGIDNDHEWARWCVSIPNRIWLAIQWHQIHLNLQQQQQQIEPEMKLAHIAKKYEEIKCDVRARLQLF